MTDTQTKERMDLEDVLRKNFPVEYGDSKQRGESLELFVTAMAREYINVLAALYRQTGNIQ